MEIVVLLDLDLNVQVSGWASSNTCSTGARNAENHTRITAGRERNRGLLEGRHYTVAVACSTGIFHYITGTVASVARHDNGLKESGGGSDATFARALRTLSDTSVAGLTRPGAIATGVNRVGAHFLCNAGGGLLQGEGDDGMLVLTRGGVIHSRPLLGLAVEKLSKVAENILNIRAGKRGLTLAHSGGGGGGGWISAHFRGSYTLLSEAIVDAALVGVGEDLVGVVDLGKCFAVAVGGVGVVVLGEAVEGLFDLILGGGTWDAEEVVVVGGVSVGGGVGGVGQGSGEHGREGMHGGEVWRSAGGLQRSMVLVEGRKACRV